ncbi:translation initiation factor [Lolliginicoccus levis]|uniref:translation initiation factor n=1 Tax=Lolliginicoccus levis TaxID=2919542 RepID=UPI00241E5F49|nr:translation initiation factor [Lolliginicoccus levis]
MASTRTGQNHLTEDDLHELSALKEAGKRATVYLREPIAGLGLEEGASARIIAIDGTSLIVKPTGVNDEIPFEAHELRRTRAAPSPAKRAPRKKAAPKAPGEAGPGRAGPAPATPKPVPVPARTATPAGTSAGPPAGSPAPGPARKPTASSSAITRPASGGGSGGGAGSGASSKSRGKSAECAITLRADEEGAWWIAVDRPGGLSLKRSSITPDAVLRAIQQLDHPGALRAAQAALNAARKAAEQRVAELRKELAEAESALESLKAD